MWHVVPSPLPCPGHAGCTATPNIAVQVYSQTQVNGLCGLNSMLALKYAAYRLMDPFGEVWLGPLTDASGPRLRPAASASPARRLPRARWPLYLMGVSIPVAVNSGDTASTIATNTVAAITASVGVACSAAVDGTNAWRISDRLPSCARPAPPVPSPRRRAAYRSRASRQLAGGSCRFPSESSRSAPSAGRVPGSRWPAGCGDEPVDRARQSCRSASRS